MTLTSNVTVNVTGNYSLALDLATKTCNLLKNYSVNLTSGTGANQADLIYHSRRTLAASGTETLDLAGGTLTDPLTGTAMTFARLKLLFVSAATGNTNHVDVTRPAAGVPVFLASTDGVSIAPGGCLVIFGPDATGFAVTATTADGITFTNAAAGTSVTYDVVLIGASV